MMRSLAGLFLLLLAHPSQSIASSSPWSVQPTAVAFLPRGGGIGGRRKKKTADETAAIDAEPAPDDNATDAEGDADADPPFDLQEVSKQVYKEEVAEIKKSQRFLQKQQRRRELDKTWLDKGITAVIELFENLFRWEVIDV